MFLLAELKDTIRIPPDTFQMKLIDAVKDEINRKLANKVNKSLYIPAYTIWHILIKEINVQFFLSKILGIIKCWPMHCAKGYNPYW